MAAVFSETGSVSAEELRATMAPIEYRGRDASGVVHTDRVGLGHQTLYTTPEQRGESQPISISDVYLTFDGRVDNRDQLLASDALRRRPVDETTSDARLVAHSYLAWGADFVKRLVGAFSFALWDASEMRFLCARDPTGIRSLYYAETDDRLVVGSELTSVVSHPAVSRSINRGAVAEFLVDDMRSRTETFYEEVRRLEHGSLLLVEDGQVDVETYWEVDDTPDYRDWSDERLADELRRRLRQAVSARLRSRHAPAFAASGGLDSTALVAVSEQAVETSSDQQRHLFSHVFDDPDESVLRAERDRIETMADADGRRLHAIECDRYWPLKDLDPYLDALEDGPVVNSLQYVNEQLYERAADCGFDAILHGGGGNIFDGNRFSYVDNLRYLDVRQFLRDLKADPMSTSSLLQWYVVLPSMPEVATTLLRHYWGEDVNEVPDWLTDRFAAEVGLDDRLSQDRPATDLTRQSMQLTHDLFFRPGKQYLLDVERRLALRSGVEVRYPYRDARVVEFVFSLPPGYRTTEGQVKYLFKEAMDGRLPDAILDQSESASFDPLVAKGLKREERETVAAILDDSALVAQGIVDEDGLEDVRNAYVSGDEPYPNQLWRVLSAELWLTAVVGEETDRTVSPESPTVT